MYKTYILFLSFCCFISVDIAAQVSGHVFRDFNLNGVQDANEIGEPNINVHIYDTSGELAGSPVTTDGNGDYSIAGGTGSLRVEFALPSWYFASNGNASNTQVQFVSLGGTANLGINSPADFSITDPPIIFPCYVNGNPLGSGDAASGDVMVSIPYNIGCGLATYAGGSAPDPDHLSFASELGTVWGIAYQKETENLFSAAFLKRHMGLGPGSDGNGLYASGAIYKTDLSGATPSNSYFFNLDELGFPTQAAGAYDATPFSPSNLVIGTNAERDLPDDKTSPNTDPAAFHQVGRVSLGDLDISDDGKYLWTVNLFDKQLYKIFIDNPATTPAASDIDNYAIPDPGCIDGDYHPWAVKYYHEKVYVSVICSAEADPIADSDDAASMATRAKMFGYVYEFDITNDMFNTTPVLTIPLNYKKGCAYGSTCPDGVENYWGNWHDLEVADREFCEPILADIEFDIEGSMILSFLDRAAHKKGYKNADPADGNSPSTDISKYNSGDILRAFYDYTTQQYILENDATAGLNTTAGAGNSEGPGGGEYYFEDVKGNDDCSVSADSHREISLGGLALLAGKGEVVNTSMDPADLHSGGLISYDNITGASSNTIRYSAYENGDDSGAYTNFGKAAGIGDVELQTDPAPIEIGNLVWNDANGNGIQDADELPIAGITVELLDPSSNPIASAITDANGHYFFSNANHTDTPHAKYNLAALTINTNNYEIRIGTGQANLSGLSLTITDNDATANGDMRDNDGSIVASNAVKTFNTTNSGENNHSYDFGFRAASSCSITVDSATPSICNTADNTYSLDVVVSYANVSGDININGTNFTPDGTSPDTFTLTGLTADGSTGNSVTASSVSDSGCEDAVGLTYNAPASCGSLPSGSCTTQHQDFANLNFITIQDLNNPADGAAYSSLVNGANVIHNDPNQIGRGSVSYEYNIADRPISIDDWIVYLNAVDPMNTNGTYHGNGGNGVRYNVGGSVWETTTLSAMNGGGTNIAAVGNFPITNISINQAAHYLNWVNTGNPEMGPYTFVTANDGNANIATYDNSYVGPRLPFLDEWYKAMFWDQANATYNLYATTNLDANGIPNTTLIDADGIHADPTAAFYNFPTNAYWAQVGQGTPSPYGLFDGTGNRHDLLLDNTSNLSIIAKVGRWQDDETRQRSSYVESFASDEATPYLSVTFRPVCGAIPENCSITVDSATPSVCNPADNTYSLDVVVSYANVSGDININGTNFTPDGTSPDTFTLTGLTADGSTGNSVTASSVSDSGCEDAVGLTYNAPTSCGSLPCPTTNCIHIIINKNN